MISPHKNARSCSKFWRTKTACASCSCSGKELVVTERDGKNIYYELAPNTLHSKRGVGQHLNLGCCRLEIPNSKR
jgi:hypothetical protein